MDVKLIPPLALKVIAFLFSEPALADKKQIWDALAIADSQLLAELRKSRLTPLIYAQLRQRNQHLQLPPAFLNEFQLDYASALKTAALQEQEALQVFRALHVAGVAFILLKGADLRLRVYEDTAQRPMNDLDILIDQANLPQARKILASLDYTLFTNSVDPFPGYWEHFGHELGFDPPQGGILPIEVHWQIRAVNSLYHIPYRAVRHKTVSVDFQGLPTSVLDREHLLIHLCLHAFSHFHDDKLKSLPAYILIDIGLTLRRLGVDWSVFLAIAEKFQCQAPIYFTLKEVARLIPHDIPPAALAELRSHQPGLAEKVALSLRLRFFTKTLAVTRHHPPREWLSFLRGNVWPNSEYLLANYGKPDRLAYWRQFLNKNLLLKNR